MINNHRFQILPPVVKNLLIINVLLFIATGILQSPPLNIDLTKILGLHYWRSELFNPWQIISYMFMHGNIPTFYLTCLLYGCLEHILRIDGDQKIPKLLFTNWIWSCIFTLFNNPFSNY